jgi:hypothetical protein
LGGFNNVSRLTQEDIFKAIKDTHRVAADTLNVGRLKIPILQAGFMAVERATIVAQQEASKMWGDLDKLTEKVLKKTGNTYNIFKQVTENGEETARHVHRFSSEFFVHSCCIDDRAVNVDLFCLNPC